MSRWLVLSDSWQNQNTDTPGCLRTPSGRTAMRWIEDQRLPLRGIILSPESWDEDFTSLLQRCRQLRPATPIHALMDRPSKTLDSTLEESVQKRLGLSESISLPQLNQFLKAHSISEVAPKSTREPLVNEGAFVGVPISDFQGCDRLIFDLHLKLSAGKFLRLIDASESQAWSRIQKYQERGVTHLYIVREAYERSLMAIRFFRDSISIHSGTAAKNWSEIRIAHSIREISRLLSDQKFLEQVDSHVWEKSQELLFQFGRAISFDNHENPSEQASRWIRRCLFLDHSLSIFVLASLIGKPLQFTRDESFLALGSAALFHDIALLNAENIPVEEKPQGLSGEALKKFIAHPSDSAAYLEDRLQADSIVVQAVMNHHWRRDGSGLIQPGRANPVFVPRLAEILGLAEECFFFLVRNPQLTLEEIPNGLLPMMEPKFSSEVVDGLRTALIHPKT